MLTAASDCLILLPAFWKQDCWNMNIGCVYIVFSDIWVWYFDCDIANGLVTEFENSADQSLYFVAEIDKKLEKNA
jgi:hypothetical protein